ncbi:MAG TPA: helix-turn-helix domain-containing protein [Thermoguttaceae bacterium]|nr:helix-turn-helix domain-containing protein [Thermoguttaceae bacterium]
MSKYKFEPDYVVTPGATLKESIEMKGISQTELAQRTGLTEKTISQIINGIAPISYETAGKLELVTGAPASFWNRRELGYREALSRRKELATLAEHKDWLKEIPLDDLIERGFVEPSEDSGTLVHRALRFFGIGSVEAWRGSLLSMSAQYRSNKANDKYPGFVSAWLRMGELQAEAIECERFNGQEFRRLLQQEVRTLTATSASVWRKTLPELCAQAGVAVVFTKEIARAAVSGAARWLPKKDVALIQVSLKFKTDDQLWFSFYHEAGHILLHGKRQLYVDYGGGNEAEDEREADGFARDLLIPRQYIGQFHQLKRKADIRRFAALVGTSPGVVVGRLQHDKYLPPSHCNDLKAKLKWK